MIGIRNSRQQQCTCSLSKTSKTVGSSCWSPRFGSKMHQASWKAGCDIEHRCLKRTLCAWRGTIFVALRRCLISSKFHTLHIPTSNKCLNKLASNKCLQKHKFTSVGRRWPKPWDHTPKALLLSEGKAQKDRLKATNQHQNFQNTREWHKSMHKQMLLKQTIERWNWSSLQCLYLSPRFVRVFAEVQRRWQQRVSHHAWLAKKSTPELLVEHNASQTLSHKVKEIIRLLASIYSSGSGPSIHQNWRRKQERHGMTRSHGSAMWPVEVELPLLPEAVPCLHKPTFVAGGSASTHSDKSSDLRDDSAPSPSPQKCNISTSKDTSQFWHSSLKPAELLEQSILPLLQRKG